MEARLRVLSGPHSGETIPIQSGKLLIGREEDCHLRPDSEFVSRHHCVLLLDDYTLRIRDLASKNGTYVNGRRIGTAETILLHDDMISIGEMIAQIDLGTATASPSTESTIAAALHGTAVFDGDTVQADGSVPIPASPESPPPLVSSPVITDLARPGSSEDTQTLHPRSARADD